MDVEWITLPVTGYGLGLKHPAVYCLVMPLTVLCSKLRSKTSGHKRSRSKCDMAADDEPAADGEAVLAMAASSGNCQVAAAGGQGMWQ